MSHIRIRLFPIVYPIHGYLPTNKSMPRKGAHLGLPRSLLRYHCKSEVLIASVFYAQNLILLLFKP